MEGAFIGLFIGLALLLLLYFKMKIYNRKGTIDIHLYDTYFVLSYAAAIVFALLFLGTFFSVGGLMASVFKSRLFWTLTLLFLSIDVYYIVSIYRRVN
jgi:hypothetical protein